MVKFQNDPELPRKVRAVSCHVSSWMDLYSLARFFKKMRGWVFRGHCKAEWSLQTKLERNYSEVNLNQESAAIRNFENLAGGMIKRDRSPISLLSYMQHYGTPTRLLDFTKSFQVALYFAFSDLESNDDHAIWIINRHEFMEKSKALAHQLSDETYSQIENGDYCGDPVVLEQGLTDSIHFDKSFRRDQQRKVANAILSGRFGDERGVLPLEMKQPFNKRLKKQQGLFLMPMSLGPFMENLKADWGSDDWRLKPIRTVARLKEKISGNGDLVMVKLVIKDCVKKDVHRYLKEKKMTATKVYPDLSGAAQAVHY